MATLALYTFEDLYLTLSGSNITAVADQSVNGYNLSEGTSGNGGVREQTGFGGYPCVLQDGTDDYLFTSSALSTNLIGGTSNTAFVMIAWQRVAAGSSGDCSWSCGNTASANMFFRFVENASNSYEFRLRDDATGAGSGSGGTGGTMDALRHVVELTRNATTFDVTVSGTTVSVANAASVASGAMTDTGCTTNRFALGCLLRSTASGFMNQRLAAVHLLDTPPTTTEKTSLRSWFSRYISAPQTINSAADRVRRDRHLHAVHRPTTWKLSKNGVMIPAEDRRIVQVNGLRAA